MGQSGRTFINKYIDKKMMVCNWEMDIAMLYVVALYIALVAPFEGLSRVVFSIACFYSVFYFSKIRNARIKGFFTHIMYMIGFLKPKSYPPSYMRYFLGG
ncbi:hypothetical protein HPU229336_05000 [Helicobacter pullorum]|uniref:Type IV conjugative transfer system protein TraL n=1 Tax=Helicobacter pullorum TaxID=35818 RepID=A0A0N1EBX3_9HELI|nr:type IV conjugative transfer system protein TraL [Helicobacter pullorum]EAI7507096.1 type IV conjugative transfer system protein TraL [Campylobacter coli]EAK6385926.1 type IV conjugative transfer system protein TraL [Campylobacter coli]ECQ5495330.1 type IV conjugative transfer system protein TraL [Campylobacter coli]EDO9587331.1 type IV conjugative transfer system protein TraL [Campylobacter coli]EJE1652082.1 type IV conjugative transfer system protein TraL [Campylobacter coli]